MFTANGELTNAEINVGDSVEFSDTMPDVTTHVATPELSQPGESASNGLTERSVGEFIDQLRTLKTALESRLKVRLASSHPVTHWLIEHTAYVLNNAKRTGVDAFARACEEHGLSCAEIPICEQFAATCTLDERTHTQDTYVHFKVRHR